MIAAIVAFWTGIRARLPSVRIAPQLAGHSLLRSYRRAVRLALSDDPVDQTCGIQQRACLIEELLDVESDIQALLMKAGTGAGIGCASNSRGLIEPVTDFS